MVLPWYKAEGAFKLKVSESDDQLKGIEPYSGGSVPASGEEISQKKMSGAHNAIKRIQGELYEYEL